MTTVSNGFMAFQTEAPELAAAHFNFIRTGAATSALDEKTEELAYLSVLAASQLTGGIPFHVASARAKGATREEVVSAILVGLPAVGLGVLNALPLALAAYDAHTPK